MPAVSDPTSGAQMLPQYAWYIMVVVLCLLGVIGVVLALHTAVWKYKRWKMSETERSLNRLVILILYMVLKLFKD